MCDCWYENLELPPVGEFCEFLIDDNWDPGIIVAHVESEDRGVQAIFQGFGYWVARNEGCLFRPLTIGQTKG